jgi:hypothetical protein
MENKKLGRTFIAAFLLAAMPAIAFAADIPILETIIQVTFKITAGCIVVGVVIVAGMFFTAGGEPEKINKAKKALIWLVIGIFIYAGISAIKSVVTGIVNTEAPAVKPPAPTE